MLGPSTNVFLRPKNKRLQYKAFISRVSRARIVYGIFVTVLVYVLYNAFSYVARSLSSYSTTNLPKSHPLTSTFTIETPEKWIYPNSEHVPVLREMGLRELFQESKVRSARNLEVEETVIYSLNHFDDPDPLIQREKDKAEEKSLPQGAAKVMFKNLDKFVHKPRRGQCSPEVVVVTAIDYNKYSADSISEIIQNRLAYGKEKDYGVYVRWNQEFMPYFKTFDELSSSERLKWMRIFCMRAAMFAFPDAKWFWYLDQNALIMNKKIDLIDYLLRPEALDSTILREQPIVLLDLRIKTSKKAKAESLALLLTQSDSKIESYSFLVKNGFLGKGLLESWSSPLYLSYGSFSYGPDSVITHVLQWHPFILSKTGLIPQRTIASRHNDVDISVDEEGLGGDSIHYAKSDLVVQWSDCKNQDECEGYLRGYLAKLGKH